MNPAQSEAADVLALWKATYAEIFPHRDPEAMRVDDADLALAVMLRREARPTVLSVEPLCTTDAKVRKPVPQLSLGKIIHGPGVSPGRDSE